MRKEVLGGIISIAATLILIAIRQDIDTLAVGFSLLADIVAAAIFAPERRTGAVLRQFLIYCAITIITLILAALLFFVYFIIAFKKPGG
ncbi:hypothetical protein [Taibaiella koreensis]|uniref:hypothetical protein n=1 Tax=Taibaiella koreensis TaxID=1268548 RepID=UPI000E59AFDE|nr:hypothetical protein [Taibaiella koreensis]